MNIKRIIGILIVVIGIACISVSYYIKGQVADGQKQVISAQKKVNKADAVIDLTPVTKDLGKGVTASAQKKIDEGKLEIVKYALVAQWLQIGGIILIVAGAATIVLGKNKKGRRSK